MQFLYLLEDLRVPVLNEFMLGITYLGDEIAFLVTALILYWCVDKRQGYYVLSVGLIGTLANQFLKIACQVPRPWVKDPEFTILEQAREGAGGYSFPSGHSQSSVGTFGGIAYTTKNKGVKWLCIAACVLVPFSRMYIGVHFPSDVLVGAGMALGMIVLMHPLIYGHEGKYIPVVFAVGAGLSLAFLAYVELFPFPADIDPYNMESAVKNAYTIFGCMTGMLVAYYADVKVLRFSVKAVWWAQLMKIVFGLALVLLVKEGTRAPLEAIFAGHMIARGIRYFLVVIMAGVIWPLTFRWFEKLGMRKD